MVLNVSLSAYYPFAYLLWWNVYSILLSMFKLLFIFGGVFSSFKSPYVLDPRLSFTPLNSLGTFAKNQLPNVRLYFWTLNSVPLIYTSVLP